MSQSLEHLESEIRRLPVDSRAELMGRLLESFRSTDEYDEISPAWAEEAERRDQAMSNGSEPSIPAQDVLDRLK